MGEGLGRSGGRERGGEEGRVVEEGWTEGVEEGGGGGGEGVEEGRGGERGRWRVGMSPLVSQSIKKQQFDVRGRGGGGGGGGGQHKDYNTVTILLPGRPDVLTYLQSSGISILGCSSGYRDREM